LNTIKPLNLLGVILSFKVKLTVQSGNRNFKGKFRLIHFNSAAVQIKIKDASELVPRVRFTFFVIFKLAILKYDLSPLPGLEDCRTVLVKKAAVLRAGWLHVGRPVREVWLRAQHIIKEVTFNHNHIIIGNTFNHYLI
jgi:hypothetical protein